MIQNKFGKTKDNVGKDGRKGWDGWKRRFGWIEENNGMVKEKDGMNGGER